MHSKGPLLYLYHNLQVDIDNIFVAWHVTQSAQPMSHPHISGKEAAEMGKYFNTLGKSIQLSFL